MKASNEKDVTVEVKISVNDNTVHPGRKLRRAAMIDDVSQIRMIIETNQVNVNTTDLDEVASAVVDPKQKEKEERDDDDDHNLTGDTALHVASEYGSLEVATHLCMAGADIEKHNKIGSTALHRACSHGRLPVITILINKFKASLNSVNKIGNLPLHCAVYSGHVDVVRFLLENGAANQIETPNKVGMRPIDYAFQPAVRKLLEEKSQDLRLP